MSNPERSKDFRYIYANSFGLQMNDNEVLVDLGIYDNVAQPDSSVVNQARVILSPRAAKMFQYILAKAIADWEKATGTVIAIPQEKLAQLETSLNATNNPPR